MGTLPLYMLVLAMGMHGISAIEIIKVDSTCKFMDPYVIKGCNQGLCEVVFSVHTTHGLFNNIQYSGYLDINRENTRISECFQLDFGGGRKVKQIKYLRIAIKGVAMGGYEAMVDGSFVYVPLGPTTPEQRIIKHTSLESLLRSSDLNTYSQREGNGIVITGNRGSDGYSFILRQGYDLGGFIMGIKRDDGYCPIGEGAVYRNCKMESLGAGANNDPAQKIYFINKIRINSLLWVMLFVLIFYATWMLCADNDSSIVPSMEDDVWLNYPWISLWSVGTPAQPKSIRLSLITAQITTIILVSTITHSLLAGSTPTARVIMGIVVGLPCGWWMHRVLSLIVYSLDEVHRQFIVLYESNDEFEQRFEYYVEWENRVSAHCYLFYTSIFLLMVLTGYLTPTLTSTSPSSHTLLTTIALSLLIEFIIIDVLRVYLSTIDGWISGYILSRGYMPDYSLALHIKEITDELL